MRLTARRRQDPGGIPTVWWAVGLTLVWVGMFLGHAERPYGLQGAGLGWWRWIDQGLYWSQAKQLASGQIDPGHFFYPPFYPWLGSLLVGVLPLHPFFWVDLGSFLIVGIGFVRIARHYMPSLLAALVFVLTLVVQPAVMDGYLVPWTTTPAAALFTLLLWILHDGRRNVATLFAFGVAWGCLVPLRFADALIATAVVLPLLWEVTFAAERDGQRNRPVPALAAMALGAALPVLTFLAFNLRAFGSLTGRYYIGDNGIAVAMYPLNLLRKAVTLFLDPTPYATEGGAILTHYPWIALGIAGLALALTCGTRLLRTIAAVVVAYVALYAIFADLLPTNIWHFGVIHYFKWLFPFFGLLAIAGTIAAWQRVLAGQWLRIPLALVPALLFLGTGWSTLGIAAPSRLVDVAGKPHLRIDVPDQLKTGTIDAVDISGVTGRYPAAQQIVGTVRVDGRVLRPALDYHLLPVAGGMRVAFAQPLEATVVDLDPLPELGIAPGGGAATALRFSLRLRRPEWVRAWLRPGPATRLLE